MSPIMYGLFRLVCWADCLHAWQYSHGRIPPPTTVDYTRAAIVYWAFLLTPIIIGCIVAFFSFRRRYPAQWPLPETGTIALPYTSFIIGSLFRALYETSQLEHIVWLGYIVWLVMLWSCVLIGGAVVAAFSNLGACLLNRTWGKFSLTVIAIVAGMFYLLWLSTFIIYIDT